jgi:carboxypeptidase D
MRDIQETAKRCNYYDYMSKYLKYPPPPAPLPLPGHSTEYDPGCDLWDTIFNAALVINPAFNIYRIFDVVFINIKPF